MASFRKEFASGVIYTSIAKYSGIVIQLVITAVLARMLKPEDFGIIALATVFIHFFNTLTEAGIGPAIIQKKEFIKKDYDALFFITAVIGLVFGLFFLLICPLIGRYYDSLILSDVCKWLSILILFSSLDIVPNNLLIKQKRFDIIAYRTVIIQMICGVASIYAAYIGWGVYSLLLSAILSKVLIFGVNYLRNPLSFSFDFSCLKGIKGYSTYQFLFNMVRYLVRNLDKIIVGKMMGMNLLGFYEKSYQLMMLPLHNITFVVTPVLQPLFSELQNDLKSMGQKYLKLLNSLAYISFPLTAILFFNARELVYIFFGSQWEPSVGPFRILALSVEIQILQSTASAIFQSANYTKGLFWGGNVSFIISAVGLVLACICFGTLSAIASCFVITNFIGVAFVYYLLFTKLNVSIISFVRQLSRPFMLMLILFLFMGLYCYFVDIKNVIVSLVLKSGLMLTISLYLLQIWDVISVKKYLTVLFRYLHIVE
jgi:PST family polysaccharide transporter